MDIVRAVQSRDGFVSDDAVQDIAANLGIHPVEVADMVSFYAFFEREPRGRFRIRLSKTPISFMKGAAAVAHAFEQALGFPIGGTDGVFSLQWTSDIGMADQEPAALVNATVLTELTPADVPKIVAGLREHGLSMTTVRNSLVQAGPLLTGPLGCADGLKAALTRQPEQIIAEITASKLRGRGGAGFPTGMKWRLCRRAIGEQHHVVCNADEGEPGTFKDRVLLTDFPDLVFDGMTIAGYALGAKHGLVYLRGEYAYLWDALQQVLENRRRLGYLGTDHLRAQGL